MFPRKARIPRELFASTRAGRRLASEHFTVLIPEKTTGYAVVVSKKTAKLSTTRHRIKRRVIGILKTLPLPQSLILFPKPSTATIDHNHLKAELAALLSKIHQ